MNDKAKAHQRFLQSLNTSTKKAFRLCQRLVKKAVDEATEAWINKVIGDAEHSSRDRKLWWDCIKKLQAAFSGRQPTCSVRLWKHDGSLTTGPAELKQLWYEHFSQVLNIPSQCNQELLDAMPSWEPMQSLDDPPTSDELEG